MQTQAFGLHHVPINSHFLLKNLTVEKVDFKHLRQIGRREAGMGEVVKHSKHISPWEEAEQMILLRHVLIFKSLKLCAVFSSNAFPMIMCWLHIALWCEY